jgi:large subunit ribosomal protein L21
MYAVIETGGKQYRVELNAELQVELTGAIPGSEISFDRVLLVRTDDTTEVGTPVVAGAKVTALVIGQERGVKTISFKYRPKARSRITKGHRQELHRIKITEVAVGGVSAKAAWEAGAAAREQVANAARAVAAEKAKSDAALAAKLAAKLAAAAPAAPAAVKAPATATEKRAPSATAAAKKPAAKKPAAKKPAAKKATSADAE